MPEGHLSTAARLLKQRTLDAHRRVEERLDLLEARTPARMLSALVTLCGFWASGEPAVDAWFATHPDVASALHWPRRARLPLLRHDLEVLAGACDVEVPAAADMAAPFGDVDHAAVLGWLYVTEGSTLGGAVIDRALRGAGFPVPLVSFTPYPEGPGPMWRSYLAHLDAWTAGSPSRTELVVAAGERTFGALDGWLAAQVPAAASQTWLLPRPDGVMA